MGHLMGDETPDRADWTAPRIYAVIAAVGAILGSIGPWATVSAGAFSITRTGTDGDGVITILAASAALVLVLTGTHLIAAIFAGVAAGVAAYDLYDLERIANDAGDGSIAVSSGWGIWLVLIGGGVCLVASLYHRMRSRPDPNAVTANPPEQ